MMSDDLRVVPSNQNYAASRSGDVVRIVGSRGTKAGRKVKSNKGPDGYHRTCLWKDNRGANRTVHSIVAEAFLGPCPEGMEVNHIDANKSNNSVENLEYVTRSQNLLHRTARGIGRGEDNAMCKTTASVVREIRHDHDVNGLGYKRLAKKYGMTWGAVRSIATRKVWRHVD